jgi:alpha-tubulin suppressor-like RCC1 family protein/uncharacterized protein YjdB
MPPGVKASRSISIAADDNSIAYISLQPETAPTGVTAVITNARLGVSVTTPMVDGGIDPVPLPAAAGDSVKIQIQTAGGITVTTVANVVPSRRPPKIVRTIPGRGKTGVPLNKNIEVLFTEPVAASSLVSSIRLFHGTSQVAGSAEILQGVTAAIVFTPTANLEPNANYDLVITAGVRDLDGDALDSTVRVPFTTGTSIEGPLASLNLIPDAADIRVGDQFRPIVVAKDAEGNVLTGHPITWWLTDSTTVNVTTTGLITGRRQGSGAIFAEVDGYFVAMTVHVSNSLHTVASVVVSFDSASVAAGGSLEVAAIAKDDDGNLLQRRLVQWTSSNTSVATVTSAASDQPLETNIYRAWFNSIFVTQSALYRANVVGVANGVAKIVATIEGRSDTVAVTVATSPPVVGFVLSADTATLLLRETTQLSAASVNSAGGRASIAGAQVQWESSNSGVASVDADGVVTAVEAGSATITGRWMDYSASIRIAVAEVAFETVSAGRTHSCALTSGGTAYCWGADDFGQSGRPGLIGGSLAFPSRIFYPKPIRAADGFTFVGITTGGFHSCGLTATGAAYCWGFNGYGSLGSGNFEDSWRPVQVVGVPSFVQIDAGTHHTCGLVTGGDAYCWGSNRSGQLGSSSSSFSANPQPVAGGIAFASISAGGAHSCALTTDGTAYCWGDNASGQLGVGSIGSTSASPLPVSGGLTFASIAAGEAHTCGMTRDGSLYCWGWNFYNQLGSGTQTTPSAVPVRAASDLHFLGIGAGSAHSCAIDASGIAWCWGDNLGGQLGIGSSGSDLFATPQRVVGSLAFQKLSVGRSHTCAQTVEGAWYCWGDNESGVLGSGSTSNSGTPLKVLGQR